jgi:fluoroquinolone resistance protein
VPKINENSATYIEGQTIAAKKFSTESFGHHSFTNCTFQSCTFSETQLPNVKFNSCTFASCNLSLVKLDGCRIQDVLFIDSKIVGAEFFKCEKTFFSASFKNSFLHYCNFSDLNMRNAIFSGCKLWENYFTNTCLLSADFRDTDLLGTTFHNCDLRKADFSTATQYAIDPQTNNIKKAKFSIPEVIGLLRGIDITIV